MVIIQAAVEYIKKGPLATRITTHHLVRISLYYFSSVFFVFNKRNKTEVSVNSEEDPDVGDNGKSFKNDFKLLVTSTYAVKFSYGEHPWLINRKCNLYRSMVFTY